MGRTEETSGTTDAELIRGIVEHDEDAFTQLVRRHGPSVHGLVKRVLRRREGHTAEVADAIDRWKLEQSRITSA